MRAEQRVMPFLRGIVLLPIEGRGAGWGAGLVPLSLHLNPPPTGERENAGHAVPAGEGQTQVSKALWGLINLLGE